MISLHQDADIVNHSIPSFYVSNLNFFLLLFDWSAMACFLFLHVKTPSFFFYWQFEHTPFVYLLNGIPRVSLKLLLNFVHLYPTSLSFFPDPSSRCFPSHHKVATIQSIKMLQKKYERKFIAQTFIACMRYVCL